MAARIVVEECLNVLLDLDDIDRLWVHSPQPRADRADLQKRRSDLLEVRMRTYVCCLCTLQMRLDTAAASPFSICSIEASVPWHSLASKIIAHFVSTWSYDCQARSSHAKARACLLCSRRVRGLPQLALTGCVCYAGAGTKPEGAAGYQGGQGWPRGRGVHAADGAAQGPRHAHAGPSRPLRPRLPGRSCPWCAWSFHVFYPGLCRVPSADA